MFAGLPGGSNGGLPASLGGCAFVVGCAVLMVSGLVWLCCSLL